MTAMLQDWLQAGYGRLVSVPKDFRIGPPSAFGWFVRQRFDQESVHIQGLEGLWVTMRGGPLPVNVLVRVEQADDGRWLMTGLLIGLNSHREITWETLRSIRPATLLAYLFSGFDPRSPYAAMHAAYPAPVVETPGKEFDLDAWERDEEELPRVLMGSTTWRRFTHAQAALRFWTESRAGVATSHVVEPITKPRASVAINLTDFAEVYLRHLASSPRRATTATAEELHVSRATAIRRLAECRRLNLIPTTRQS